MSRSTKLSMIAILFIFPLLVTEYVHAEEKCTNSQFHGRYSVLLQEQVGAKQVAGLFDITPDGKGAITSGTGTEVIAGVVQPPINVTSGSYSISANCQGTVTLVTDTQGTIDLAVTLVDHGHGMVVLATDFGATESGFARKVASDPDARCSNATLQGAYVLRIAGSEEGAPFTITINLTADGQGNFNDVSLNLAASGFVATGLPFPVSYTVNADCSGIFTVFVPGNTRTIAFVASHDGNQGLLIAFHDDDDGDVQAGDIQRLFPRPSEDND